MPAPKGNKNATKGDHAKNVRFQIRMTSEMREKLDYLADKNKLSITELIEKLIIREYQKNIGQNK